MNEEDGMDINPHLDHLWGWVTKQFNKEDQQEIYAALVETILDDPEYWINQDHWKLYDKTFPILT